MLTFQEWQNDPSMGLKGLAPWCCWTKDRRYSEYGKFCELRRTEMSDEFVLSMYLYYKRNLNCGPSRDWNMIAGLLNTYRSEAQRRGLI